MFRSRSQRFVCVQSKSTGTVVCLFVLCSYCLIVFKTMDLVTVFFLLFQSFLICKSSNVLLHVLIFIRVMFFLLRIKLFLIFVILVARKRTTLFICVAFVIFVFTEWTTTSRWRMAQFVVRRVFICIWSSRNTYGMCFWPRSNDCRCSHGCSS